MLLEQADLSRSASLQNDTPVISLTTKGFDR